MRIAGNPALQYAIEKHGGRVLGFFCFDSEFLSRKDFSPNRFAFFLATLKSLREELRAQGGDLLVADAMPGLALPKIVKWARESGLEFAELTHNRDYEPYARARDEEVAKLMQKLGVALHTERDHLIVEPSELHKDEPGSFYQVFTPFSKKWFKLKAAGEIRDRLDKKRVGLAELKRAAAGDWQNDLFALKWNFAGVSAPYPDMLEKFIAANAPQVTVPVPAAGSKAIWDRLTYFKKHIEEYGEARDVPSVDGTSKFSFYFKNGSLSSAQAVAFLGLSDNTLEVKNSATKFLQEIVWREFYYHILFHHPRVEHEAFLVKYKELNWEKNPAWLKKWQDGQTGFPIIDAGMRQLKQTGWMHNRVRMIVSSFLTKDLLISWQEGERHFMRELIDGDLAPNNGGWQWAASTGCDPQPYFRVFNPWLQSAKFDPEAKYIREFVPELKNISLRDIHREEGDRGRAYPSPMVDHATRKKKAIALYKK